MDYSRPRAPRLAHSRLSPSVSPAELYFLIARFLSTGPCRGTLLVSAWGGGGREGGSPGLCAPTAALTALCVPAGAGAGAGAAPGA